MDLMVRTVKNIHKTVTNGCFDMHSSLAGIDYLKNEEEKVCTLPPVLREEIRIENLE